MAPPDLVRLWINGAENWCCMGRASSLFSRELGLRTGQITGVTRGQPKVRSQPAHPLPFALNLTHRKHAKKYKFSSGVVCKVVRQQGISIKKT